MSNTVTLKKSSVVGKIPQTTDLAFGEVALNFADGRLYYRNSSDQIDFFEKSGESAGSFFLLKNDTDLGLVSDSNVTSFLDAGFTNESVSNLFDLNFVAITGYVKPDDFVLPNYTASTSDIITDGYVSDGYVATGYASSSPFPRPVSSGQVVYVSDNDTLAFSDGNTWTQLSTVSKTGSYNDLSDTPSEGITTGKAIAMAIVFG